jgi:hypothetical protein
MKIVGAEIVTIRSTLVCSKSAFKKSMMWHGFLSVVRTAVDPDTDHIIDTDWSLTSGGSRFRIMIIQFCAQFCLSDEKSEESSQFQKVKKDLSGL